MKKMNLVAILGAILAFSVLIIVHELGHFTLAKLNGVRVEEFAIGMGPKVISKKGKETTYSLRLFPIGGFVNMMGEEEAVQDKRSFSEKSPLRRISIIVAGAFMNYILAIIIFACIAGKFGYAVPEVANVLPGYPAIEAGLKEGDRVLKIDDSKVFTQDDVTIGILMAKGEPVDLTVKRGNEVKNFTIKPKLSEENQYMIGVGFAAERNPGIGASLKHSVNKTASLVSQTFKGLKMIFTGKSNLKTDVGGPLTIIKMSAKTAESGIWSLMRFVGFISVSLAVFNMLPFPALDGGWTVILLIELITRRKVPNKIVENLNYVGFMLLIGLMILVTIKDIIFPVKF
ncbi:M50 family metallopeptidase [Clostridium taeniosporum]|uniref:RIP metalloprotease RseP n=1 Tax=Clostridium taeniosporum TaxID=394958 RepID=A0A1D7XIX1_9CLOT|nr:M50 family metallopeptidase [Clostridium taeniosporum]AOR23275.1 RIP metalloprotease RseP [Clostridium taeniosporum]